MTTLLTQIRADALTARKARDSVASSLLITLGAEAAMAGINDGKRDSTDGEVQAAVRKFLKGNTETLAVRPTDEVALREKVLLEGYLPKQLDEAQLRTILQDLAAELGLEKVTGKDTGALMKALSARYAGQYAGAVASALIKEMAA